MARRPKPVSQMTLAQFEATFPDEDACKAYLVARRWPEGVRCPRCGGEKVFPVKTMPYKWQCYSCAPGQGYRFSHLAGTIFENTNKPLRQWFRVAHLMLASNKGMSALQIQRMMGFGSYETAHSMCHKIRAALVAPEERLGGIVEIDETYIGGKAKDKHGGHHPGGGRGPSGKFTVIGAVERKGNIIARVLASANQYTVQRFLDATVSDRVSLLATDEAGYYYGLEVSRSAVPSITAPSNMSSARFTRTRLRASGRSSSAGSWVPSTRSARNTFRCTLQSSSSATITATTPISSERL